MSDYYIGGIGKDYDYKLVSEMPFVIFDDEKKEFSGVATLVEALSFVDSEFHKVYVFSPWTANWEEVNFAAAASGTSKPAIGFLPN